MPSAATASAASSDVCIVGGGPAGIAIARELLRSGLTICMVESGGHRPSAVTEALARGIPTGEPIHPAEENTRRALGGASHAWDIRTGRPAPHLRYMPLAADDFEAREWLPHSGWPFPRATLDPFYERAQAFCGIGPLEYTPERWEKPGALRLPLGSGPVETAMCQFGPASVFHTAHREALQRAERAGRLRLMLHLTALRLMARQGSGLVHRLLCAKPDGAVVSVEARAFVLASGGFQNARLLLMSDDAEPAGLGNRHGVVGRYLHDHPLVFGGLLTPRDPAMFARAALYDIRTVGGVPVMGYLDTTPESRREARLAGFATFLFPRPEPRSTHALEAVRDGLRLLRSGAPMPIGPVTVAKLFARRPGVTLRGCWEAFRRRPVLSGFKEGGWSRQRPPGTGWRSFHLWHQVEQSPDPDNRVTLGSELDRFGCPLPAIHWRWAVEDDARVARAQDLMARAIEAAGLGTFDVSRRGERTDLAYPAGAHHIMGTTRMHDDPRQGVVDADCRVHGIGNLFVAGSSVFPTGGSANPTLTIIALALRLADHLRRELAPPATVERKVEAGANAAALQTARGH